jgi:crotonobetainyl-CoA:carnitine CoA-transferase CaiB-like acyl-CoA transferase
VHEIERSDGTPVKFLGFPAKLSASPADYRHAPPRSGENTIAVLEDKFALTKEEIERLLAAGVIAEKL